MQALPLTSSQGNSSHDQHAQKSLYVKTKVANSSPSPTEPRMSAYSGAQSPATPLTPLNQTASITPRSSATPVSKQAQPPPRAPPEAVPPEAATTAAAPPAPSAEVSGHVSGATGSLSGRALSGEGLLGERAMFAFSELLAAADSISKRHGPARPRRAATGTPPADAVGEAMASRRSLEASTPATRSMLKSSPYVILDSDASGSAHATPTLSSAGNHSTSRHYGSVYLNAREILALEPATASGGAPRSAGDVLRSLERATSAGQSDTYGSQMPAPWPDRMGMAPQTTTGHSMRSALSVYAAAQVPDSAQVTQSDASSMSDASLALGVPSYGPDSPARVSVEPAEPGAGSSMHPEISLHLSGLGDAGGWMPRQQPPQGSGHGDGAGRPPQ